MTLARRVAASLRSASVLALAAPQLGDRTGSDPAGLYEAVEVTEREIAFAVAVEAADRALADPRVHSAGSNAKLVGDSSTRDPRFNHGPMVTPLRQDRSERKAIRPLGYGLVRSVQSSVLPSSAARLKPLRPGPGPR